MQLKYCSVFNSMQLKYCRLLANSGSSCWTRGHMIGWKVRDWWHHLYHEKLLPETKLDVKKKVWYLAFRSRLKHLKLDEKDWNEAEVDSKTHKDLNWSCLWFENKQKQTDKLTKNPSVKLLHVKWGLDSCRETSGRLWSEAADSVFPEQIEQLEPEITVSGAGFTFRFRLGLDLHDSGLQAQASPCNQLWLWQFWFFLLSVCSSLCNFLNRCHLRGRALSSFHLSLFFPPLLVPFLLFCLLFCSLLLVFFSSPLHCKVKGWEESWGKGSDEERMRSKCRVIRVGVDSQIQREKMLNKEK